MLWHAVLWKALFAALYDVMLAMILVLVDAVGDATISTSRRFKPAQLRTVSCFTGEVSVLPAIGKQVQRWKYPVCQN